MCKGPLCKGLVQPASSFDKATQRAGGLRAYCKKCDSVAAKRRNNEFIKKVSSDSMSGEEAAGERRCTTCGDVKPVTEFDAKKGARSGHATMCKDCRFWQRRFRAAIKKPRKRWLAAQRSPVLH